MITPRTSIADVKAVLGFVTTKKNEDIPLFLQAANQVVTDLCSTVTTYTADRLKLIETWLAAHFLAVSDKNYYASLATLENIGEQTTQYQQMMIPPQKFGATYYGQQALLLDTAGGLAYLSNHVAQGKRAKVGITYLGTCPGNIRDRSDWLFLRVVEGF